MKQVNQQEGRELESIDLGGRHSYAVYVALGGHSRNWITVDADTRAKAAAWVRANRFHKVTSVNMVG